MVAVDFALEYPERTLGLVLEAPTLFAGWQWREELPVKPMFEAVKSGGIPGLRETVLGSDLMASVMSRPGPASLVTEMVGRYEGWHFQHRDSARWAEQDAVSRLEEIDVPTLVIWGRHDRVFPLAIGERLANSLDARIEVLEDSSHSPNLEQPDRFNALVLEFLR